MILTDKQRNELAELEKHITATWHKGEKEVEEAIFDHIISHIYKKTNIKLARAAS